MRKDNPPFFHEYTRLTDNDTYLIFDRLNSSFDYPIHYHREFELNYIKNGNGLQRIVGDHISIIGDDELVFIGPNQPHGWKKHLNDNSQLREITIHFHDHLFDSYLVSKNIMENIRNLLLKSRHGIEFSKSTIAKLAPRLENISNLEGMDAFLEFLSILEYLAVSPDQKLLSKEVPEFDLFDKDHRISIVNEFIRENFHRKIKLDEVSSLVAMSNASFNRFIKKSTGQTFINYLNKARIQHASRMLVNTNLKTSEIAYYSGFNNISNFNRAFKNHKNLTPSEYRKKYLGLTKFQ